MPVRAHFRSQSSAYSGIVVVGVSKRLGGRVVLAPTDLTAPAGVVSLLLGRNGAGKTTMLRILATLVSPDAGSVRVNGLDPLKDGRRVRGQIGLALVNERSVFWRLTVLENLALFARVRGIASRERKERCLAVLEELGLAELAGREAFALSAGQRQRVILGRALVGDPPVLLIDEPLRGLDADAEALVLAALEARAARGDAVLVATPSLREYAAFPQHHVTHLQAPGPAGAESR